VAQKLNVSQIIVTVAIMSFAWLAPRNTITLAMVENTVAAQQSAHLTRRSVAQKS